MKTIYLIGSLRNPGIPALAQTIRSAGYDVFDDWFAAGPTADDCWRDYEKSRSHSYIDALSGYAAKHVFEFDRHHLTRSDACILALPAGKSSHLELGWMLGQGKPGFVLIDTPERWDVMYQFATGVYASVDKLIGGLDYHLNLTEKETSNGYATGIICDRDIRSFGTRDSFVGIPQNVTFGNQGRWREAVEGDQAPVVARPKP